MARGRPLLDADKQSDLLAAQASQLRAPVEGGARWSDGRHVSVVDDTGRPRGRGTPSGSSAQRQKWAASVEAALRGCC